MQKTIKRMMAVVIGVSGMNYGSMAYGQEVAPDFRLPDVNGNTHGLAQYAGKIVVLEWTNYDCPFVRKFYGAGAMQALQAKYTEVGVVWLSVCSSAAGKQGNFTKEEWLRRVSSSGVKATAVLLDETGVTGKAYGAKNTPHIFIIDKAGNIAYKGAVDDKRSASPEGIEGARNYVKETLDALIGGKPVAVPESQPYGCSVKY